MKMSQPEWDVMEVLWSGSDFSLKEITSALYEKHQWSSNTVHTYLTRMNKKELLTINKGTAKPYKAAVSKENCAKAERDDLLTKVYGGAAGDMIAAFLKETSISSEEIKRLHKLLDEMEV